MSRRFRLRPLAAPIVATAVAASAAAHAQDVTLRMSREIESPYRRGLPTPGAAPEATAPRFGDSLDAPLPPVAPLPSSALRPPAAPEERGAVYLRADRLEGHGDKRVDASGRVELRTRRETVLADSLSYDVEKDEIYAKGEVTFRKGLDWISGPEVKFQREREIGYFDEPRFFISENQSHGEAKEIRFAGPNLYEASKAQYTTCVAPNNDWYLRADEIEVDKLRKVGTAHDASVYFLGVPVMYTPWLEFPLSNERKSGFLTPTIGSTQIRGFEFSAPYYFNLAPNYDATVTPRIMTRRGIQIAAKDVTCSRVRGPAHRRGRARGPPDAHHALGGGVEAQPAVAPLARRLRQLQPRIGQHLPRRLLGPRRRHVAEDAAAGSGPQRHVRTAHRACARAGVPDAAGSQSRGVRDAAVQHAAAGEGSAERVRLARSHVERARGVRALLAIGAQSDGRSRHDISVDALDPAG
jgi:hypothetical protein